MNNRIVSKQHCLFMSVCSILIQAQGSFVHFCYEHRILIYSFRPEHHAHALIWLRLVLKIIYMSRIIVPMSSNSFIIYTAPSLLKTVVLVHTALN